jgi:hypothetical protein
MLTKCKVGQLVEAKGHSYSHTVGIAKMKRRRSILAALRRHRERLGRFVVASFAVASFTMAGAPCFAMANAGADAVDHAPAQTQGHAHHGHAMDQGDVGAAVGHSGDSEQPRPAHCPHCLSPSAMPSHGSSADHTSCSAVDEPAGQTSLSSPPVLAKHVVPLAAFEAPPPLIFRPPPRSSPRSIGSQGFGIALNLRHCVFLI